LAGSLRKSLDFPNKPAIDSACRYGIENMEGYAIYVSRRSLLIRPSELGDCMAGNGLYGCAFSDGYLTNFCSLLVLLRGHWSVIPVLRRSRCLYPISHGPGRISIVFLDVRCEFVDLLCSSPADFRFLT
jgi:hypothetical protein